MNCSTGDSDGEITATRSLGDEFYPCDDVILAIGQENAFPWIERDVGIELDRWNVPKVDKVTLVRAKTPKVTFKDGELTVHVNPDDGWSGRVTPEAITNALTSARNAG